VFYFAPLYIDGLAEHWEIMVFIAGVILLLVELFVIPGFGVAGISGIVLIVSGLTLALLKNVQFDFSGISVIDIFKSFAFVVFFVFTALIGSIWISGKLLTQGPFSRLALARSEQKEDGFTSAPSEILNLNGQIGVAYTFLRPAGKVMIGDRIYDAIADTSWIEKGENVIVIRQETMQVYVKKIE
jgi:membrane-bound serine protease (ClpP class)